MRHISEAAQFTAEVGGCDADVKAYLFSLEGTSQARLLRLYGQKYGSSAATYAQNALPRWKSGATIMSGMVAKRLFEFIPMVMAYEDKIRLAEKLWKRLGPSSKAVLTIGPHADRQQVEANVLSILERQVTAYELPKALSERFAWLAERDVSAMQQLLNHFRSLEAQLARQQAASVLPLLQQQASIHADTTKEARLVLRVHKHEILIQVAPAMGTDVVEGVPVQPQAESSSSVVFVLLVLCAVLWWLLAS